MQLQSWGVVGAQQLKGHVLLNGASLTGANQEVDAIIQSMSVQENLPSVIGVNMTSVLSKSQPLCSKRKHNVSLKNWYFNLSLPLGTCTVLRSRECILEGSELHWTDRVFCDGTVYLTLDHNDTWTPHVPQALALKELWDQELERTREERIRLQEGCFKLMRELGLSVETSGTWNNSKHFYTVVFWFQKEFIFVLTCCLTGFVTLIISLLL